VKRNILLYKNERGKEKGKEKRSQKGSRSLPKKLTE